MALQLLLMERKLSEVHPLLTLCGTIVENWQGNPIQKESLRVFFLVLQVTHYLDAGQVQPVFYHSNTRLKHLVVTKFLFAFHIWFFTLHLSKALT